jgi:hypothetical protein
MRSSNFRNKTKNFIETGSHTGIGIDLALASGFEKVYSIELMEHYYNLCKNKFIDDVRVELILGDSYDELGKLLKLHPDTPFTYWLDGHYSGGDTGYGIKETPLIKELETILSRNIDGELVYIDDMRLYRKFDDEVNSETIKSVIKKYKPDATLWYESSQFDPNDILCIEY